MRSNVIDIFSCSSGFIESSPLDSTVHAWALLAHMRVASLSLLSDDIEAVATSNGSWRPVSAASARECYELDATRACVCMRQQFVDDVLLIYALATLTCGTTAPGA